ncbi:MAG: S8 family serine peptidase [Planctomycetota bacterium]
MQQRTVTRLGIGLLITTAVIGLSGVLPWSVMQNVPKQALAQAVEPIKPATSSPPTRRSVRQLIGYEDAFKRLRREMPTGQGVPFAHVEGNAGQYRPDLDGPPYDAVAFSYRSGESQPSGHATATARIIYGSKGLAPGVEVVHCMTSADFLGKLTLNSTTTGPPIPATDSPFEPRVYTHSWIGSPPEVQSAMILRRVDYLVDTRDVVMVAGVNNGRDTPVPPLLGSSYNAIAVGTTGGNSSGGVTSVDLPGRSKPDLVAPRGQTSYTTPVVAAVAALLLEQADRLVEAGHDTANRAEVIKAALLSGATKPKKWVPLPGQPLDPHLGAGVVNVDRSLRVLAVGPAPPGEQIKRLAGWSFPTIARGGSADYSLKLPVDTGRASFTITWHRRIDGRTAVATRKDTGEKVGLWLDAPRVADVDLRLISIAEDGSETVLADSVSRVDNVEHLYLPKLAKGEYRLELVREAEHDQFAEDWEVAFTWVIDKPRKR